MSSCNKCEKATTPLPEAIPYHAHQAFVARLERQLHRMWVMVILLIVMLVGTNAGWLIYESQWMTVSQAVSQEADNGENCFIGGDVNGTADYPNP